VPPTNSFELKTRLFLYLTDLLVKLPHDACPGMPEIWIDGTGALACDTGLSFVLYASAADCWTSKIPTIPLIAVVNQIHGRFHTHWIDCEVKRDGTYIPRRCLFNVWMSLLRQMWLPMDSKWERWGDASRKYKQQVADEIEDLGDIDD